MDEAWTRVAGVADVPDGAAIPVELMGMQLALFHLGDEWFCTSNVCTHAYALLTDGFFEEHVAECPLHAGQFDVRTGKGLGPPIDQDLVTFPVRVVGEDVEVALPG